MPWREGEECLVSVCCCVSPKGGMGRGGGGCSLFKCWLAIGGGVTSFPGLPRPKSQVWISVQSGNLGLGTKLVEGPLH